MENSVRLIVIAIVLLLIGVILPFLMVLWIIKSTLFLNFLSNNRSLIGLIIGFIGIAQYIRGRR